MEANKKVLVTVKQILETTWQNYKESHKLREVEIKEVEKTINCYGQNNGCFVFYCKECSKYIFQHYGCNSRICSNCGKRYTDQWAQKFSKQMFNVPHRHFVMSIPNALWAFLKEDRKRWKGYMDSAIETCNDYFPKILRNANARVGIIVIFHPFGKDMKFQPHLHIIVTEGAFDSKGHFIKHDFIPARKFAKCWQYHVLKNLQKAGLSNDLASEMYRKYDGFYVWVHKSGRIHNPKFIAKYLGRYVRHPAIANSRIDYFDGTKVQFHYYDHEDNKHEIVMPVDEFITALLQHIPEPQFKMIRYYGAYARRTKRIFKSYLQSSITQLILTNFDLKKDILCPICKSKLDFVCYCKKPPPLDKQNLNYWIDLVN